MPTDLSVKQVPDEVTNRLRERARRNHRSLQGELRAILDAATTEPDASAAPKVREAAVPYPGDDDAAAGGLSPEDADEMLTIIEREFEQVDPRDWR